MAKDEKKKKFEKLVSPKGLSTFAWINKPDTKFDEVGVYSITVALDPNEDPKTQAFINDIQARAEAAFEKGKAKAKPAIRKSMSVSCPLEEQDDEDGDETGKVLLKAKNKAYFVNKDTHEKTSLQPKVFDATGKAYDKIPQIGKGSVVRVSVTPVEFVMPATKTAGITLRINAVQIIKLESFDGGSAEDYGFGDESDDDMDMPWDQEDTGDAQTADDEDGDF